jgi:hypothetical protein
MEKYNLDGWLRTNIGSSVGTFARNARHDSRQLTLAAYERAHAPAV